MAYPRGTVFLKCPQCKRDYHRLYKEYDNGFGFCVDHPAVRVVRASTLQSEKKLARIKAELNGSVIPYARPAKATNRSGCDNPST